VVRVHAVIALKAEHWLDVVLDAAGFARSTFVHLQARFQAPDL
jgi:putative transposase